MKISNDNDDGNKNKKLNNKDDTIKIESLKGKSNG